MTRLALILQRLIADARPGQGTATILTSGLRVSVRVLAGGWRQMSLTRTASVRPSRKEAEVCARDAGWVDAGITEGTTRTGLPCLLISEDVDT